MFFEVVDVEVKMKICRLMARWCIIRSAPWRAFWSDFASTTNLLSWTLMDYISFLFYTLTLTKPLKFTFYVHMRTTECMNLFHVCVVFFHKIFCGGELNFLPDRVWRFVLPELYARELFSRDCRMALHAQTAAWRVKKIVLWELKNRRRGCQNSENARNIWFITRGRFCTSSKTSFLFRWLPWYVLSHQIQQLLEFGSPFLSNHTGHLNAQKRRRGQVSKIHFLLPPKKVFTTINV